MVVRISWGGLCKGFSGRTNFRWLGWMGWRVAGVGCGVTVPLSRALWSRSMTDFGGWLLDFPPKYLYQNWQATENTKWSAFCNADYCAPQCKSSCGKLTSDLAMLGPESWHGDEGSHLPWLCSPQGQLHFQTSWDGRQMSATGSTNIQPPREKRVPLSPQSQ